MSHCISIVLYCSHIFLTKSLLYEGAETFVAPISYITSRFEDIITYESFGPPFPLPKQTNKITYTRKLHLLVRKRSRIRTVPSVDEDVKPIL